MKKLLAMILALCLLTGCQLASTEKKENRMDDKLVGVFVTFESLDLEFDMEGYLKDNGHSVSDGEEIILGPGEGTAYEEKLWAEVTEEGWSFPGHEGLIMGQMWREDHWAGFTTEGFCGVATHATRTDTHDGIEETGTIYVPSDAEEILFYSNPVYMTPEGEYYAVRGSSLGSEAYFGSMSQTVSDEKTWTEGDVSYTYSAEFKTVVEGVKLADRVTVIHMSADNAELERAEYVPGQMPESITPAEGTAYVIVEEAVDEEILRTLYQPGDEGIRVFWQEEQVYCLPWFTEILWDK